MMKSGRSSFIIPRSSFLLRFFIRFPRAIRFVFLARSVNDSQQVPISSRKRFNRVVKLNDPLLDREPAASEISVNRVSPAILIRGQSEYPVPQSPLVSAGAALAPRELFLRDEQARRLEIPDILFAAIGVLADRVWVLIFTALEDRMRRYLNFFCCRRPGTFR